MAGGYNFVSPGGMAGNAIEQFLMQREQMERQRIIDALTQKSQADQVRMQEEALRQSASREANDQARTVSDQSFRASQAATEAERYATEQRQRQNQIGIVQMLGDAYTQAGDPMRGLAVQAGINLPQPAAPRRTNVTVPGPNGRPMERSFTEDELAAGVEKYVAPTGGSRDNEPLVAIMGPDGQSVLVPRSQAVNKRPASTRDQGRPVMSSDAGRIADFDTSLDDVDVLERELGTTGAASKLGAMVPNVVTEVTRFGADAKSRQAVIDRVKQVIGKALEGGVLRKEDEYKYEKILPTIGDPPSVATTKIDGLRSALIQRRSRLVESLGDAGFDTAKFAEGKAPAVSGVQKWGRDAAGRPVRLP